MLASHLTDAVQVVSIFPKVKILGNLLRSCARSLLTPPHQQRIG